LEPGLPLTTSQEVHPKGYEDPSFLRCVFRDYLISATAMQITQENANLASARCLVAMADEEN
jgi:hypothetical protein